MSGEHLSLDEIRRRLSAMGPAHERMNTAALAIVEPETFDSFVADLKNLARVYLSPDAGPGMPSTSRATRKE
jgi:hypothetical protein